MSSTELNEANQRDASDAASDQRELDRGAITPQEFQSRAQQRRDRAGQRQRGDGGYDPARDTGRRDDVDAANDRRAFDAGNITQAEPDKRDAARRDNAGRANALGDNARGDNDRRDNPRRGNMEDGRYLGDGGRETEARSAPLQRVAAEPTRDPGNFEQPATAGTVNASGHPVRILEMPAIAKDWRPGSTQLVMRDGAVALAIPIGPDDDDASITDKLEHLRLAVWHVRNGVSTPPDAAHVQGTNCPACGAPEWAKDDRRRQARVA
jgi:hypothetical protein